MCPGSPSNPESHHQPKVEGLLTPTTLLQKPLVQGWTRNSLRELCMWKKVVGASGTWWLRGTLKPGLARSGDTWTPLPPNNSQT